MQEEEKCIHYVLENKWQITGFLVLVHTNVSEQEEEVVERPKIGSTITEYCLWDSASQTTSKGLFCCFFLLSKFV